jgi:hypothetical protein
MKYRLKIPEKYIEIIPSIAKFANGKEVLVESYNGDYANVISCMSVFTVKVKWLEPIEDGPASAEKFFKEKYKCEPKPDSNYNYNDYEILDAYRKGEASDRKCTQPVIDCLRSLLDCPIPKWVELRALESLKTLEENETTD